MQGKRRLRLARRSLGQGGSCHRKRPVQAGVVLTACVPLPSLRPLRLYFMNNISLYVGSGQVSCGTMHSRLSPLSRSAVIAGMTLSLK